VRSNNWKNVWVILIISFLSGSTTVLGVILAMVLKGRVSYVSMGSGFSSGIMIVISFLELIVKALSMSNELFVIICACLIYM